jgi:phosphatidyl-myo-inositol dimannoside synthase
MATLLLSENFPPAIGGTARWFWELYRRMPRSEVAIAAGTCTGDREFDRTHDLRVERLPLSFAGSGVLSIRGWRRQRRAVAAIRSVMRREGVRQVHCARPWPEGWLALQCRAPYGCFVHGEELAIARTSRQLRWATARALRHAGVFFVNSRNTARILQEDWQVSDTKIRILHPGVDTGHFIPVAPDEGVRAQLGWSGRLVVLTVSRLQKRKGHDQMIAAVGILRCRFPRLLYAIVGDGEEGESLREQVRRNGLADHVRFHGALDDAGLVQAYQQCDLFVLPNRSDGIGFEGFGMVLLEAQACARAVVAGASGGTLEAVQHGETGLLVDCTRPEELADAVAALLSDTERRERMARHGRSWVERTFDFDAHAAQTARLLEIAPAR